jgi:hypothetical protein
VSAARWPRRGPARRPAGRPRHRPGPPPPRPGRRRRAAWPVRRARRRGRARRRPGVAAGLLGCPPGGLGVRACLGGLLLGPAGPQRRLQGLPVKDVPLLVELGGPLGERPLGLLAARERFLPVPLGRQLRLPGPGGVLGRLGDLAARLQGHRRDLQVQCRRVGQDPQLLAEQRVRLPLGGQRRQRRGVLPSRLVKQLGGVQLRVSQGHRIQNGSGSAATAVLRRLPMARVARFLIARFLIAQSPPVAGVVLLPSAGLGAVGLLAVLPLPSRARCAARRPPPGTAGPAAPLLVRDFIGVVGGRRVPDPCHERTLA